ncbi:MAG: hypothetical protein AAFV25_15135 [Bacteroidota bacterium]
MAKKSATLSIGLEDVIYLGAGVLGGMAINGTINQFANDWDPNMKKMIPVGKMAVGGGAAFTKKLPKEVRLMGLGLGVIGAIETAKMAAPDVFTISGFGEDGDFYDEIAGPASDYDILPLNAGGGRVLQEHAEDAHVVLGMGAADVM